MKFLRFTNNNNKNKKIYKSNTKTKKKNQIKLLNTLKVYDHLNDFIRTSKLLPRNEEQSNLFKTFVPFRNININNNNNNANNFLSNEENNYYDDNDDNNEIEDFYNQQFIQKAKDAYKIANNSDAIYHKMLYSLQYCNKNLNIFLNAFNAIKIILCNDDDSSVDIENIKNKLAELKNKISEEFKLGNRIGITDLDFLKQQYTRENVSPLTCEEIEDQLLYETPEYVQYKNELDVINYDKYSLNELCTICKENLEHCITNINNFFNSTVVLFHKLLCKKEIDTISFNTFLLKEMEKLQNTLYNSHEIQFIEKIDDNDLSNDSIQCNSIKFIGGKKKKRKISTKKKNIEKKKNIKKILKKY